MVRILADSVGRRLDLLGLQTDGYRLVWILGKRCYLMPRNLNLKGLTLIDWRCRKRRRKKGSDPTVLHAYQRRKQLK